MPAAEVEIDENLVRRLLQDQAPALAQRPLEGLAYGWDNVIFRLGDDLTVRLPRRELAATLVEHEAQWLPVLAPRLPLPIPVPVFTGRPTSYYPWSWNVGPWFPGNIAEHEMPRDPVAAAELLGQFVAALHTPAPPDAPINPFRGTPLDHRSARLASMVEQLDDDIDGPAVLSAWSRLVTTPAWSGPPLWLHGDLHPANILVRGGEISAVIDFGDLTSGDPATDLSVAWMMLPPGVRPTFRSAVGDVDDDTWTRARGWALALGLAYLANSADEPVFTNLGQRVIHAVLDD